MTPTTTTPTQATVAADLEETGAEMTEEELEVIAIRELDAVVAGYDAYLDRAVELFVESFASWTPERIIERFTRINLSRANEETHFELRFEIRDATVELVGEVVFTEREEWEPPQPGDDNYDEDEEYDAPEPEVWTEEFDEVLINFSHEGEQGALSRDEAEFLIWDNFEYSVKRNELPQLSAAAIASLNTDCEYLSSMEEVAKLCNDDWWLAVQLHVAGSPLTPPSLLVSLYSSDSADERVASTARANRRDEVVEWLETQGMEAAGDIPEGWLGLIFG